VGDEFDIPVGLVVSTAITVKSSAASSLRIGANGRVEVVGVAARPSGKLAAMGSTVEVGGIRLVANRLLPSGPVSVGGWVCAALHHSPGTEPLSGVVTSIGFLADGPVGARDGVATFPSAMGQGPLQRVASTCSREDVDGAWVIEIETAGSVGQPQRHKRR
jgi:hypothetical protein